MKSGSAAIIYIKMLAVFLLSFLLVAVLLLPLSIHAEEDEDKTVRVGWYDSTFNTMDSSGRRSGYGYEYQMKIAAYTGWDYEYVTGSWSELMEMLKNGEIDLLSDVSYTPERTEFILYPDLPMGTEEYYLFTAAGNHEITADDLSTLEGKKIGVNKGSIQKDFYEEWAREHGVETMPIEISCSEEESLEMLENGELDAYITVDTFGDPERIAPVCKIGSSDFFFAVNKDRPDLLKELNSALNRIQNENRYYNQQLFEKYFKRAGANALLSAEEEEWLSEHGPIRVGYQDNYLAFCAADPETGELTGALKDYLESASDCIVNAQLDFETTAYPTSAAAIEAMKRGEVDCVFPANFSAYDAEAMDLFVTQPLMRTDIYAVVRNSDQNSVFDKPEVVVAVNEGNPNYDAFLAENYPNWKVVYYPDTTECLKAVSNGEADCVLISNYRYNNIARACEKYHLTAFATGTGLDYCFAINKGENALYSILAKVTEQVPDSTINAALSYYITEDAKTTVGDFISDHIVLVLIVAGVIVLVILFLLVRSSRAEKKAAKLIAATETDTLTGLYNRDYFFQYANRMYQEHPDTPMDAIVMNIEQFHLVNALNGREFGDLTLRTLGKEISDIAKERGGIAGRFGADRFDIYCPHTDDYLLIFDRLQGCLDGLAQNTSIRLRMGVMPWQANLEPEQLFDRARTACSMARGNYQEPLIIFDERVREREVYESRLLNDLRRALDSGELEVYYQPKYDIQQEPPKLITAEALVRWRHPQLGMIPPDDFVPLFERNGKIGEVDKYVWARAAEQIVKWKEQYGFTIPVSVNLSRVDVFDPTLEDTLEEIIARNGLNRRMLPLEVTESAYTENADQVIRVVESLRKKGYTVEMDDFGSGYSSLNMLSSMPIDVLKMDRTFIQNIEHDEKDIQLVALIIGTAKSLNIPVIAEGVETESQLRLLKELGCEMVQGFYFSRPLHPSDFEKTILCPAISE